MEIFLTALLILAVITLVIVVVQQIRGNRQAHRSDTPLQMSQSWVLIVVNIAVLMLCVYLLARIWSMI